MLPLALAAGCRQPSQVVLCPSSVCKGGLLNCLHIKQSGPQCCLNNMGEAAIYCSVWPEGCQCCCRFGVSPGYSSAASHPYPVMSGSPGSTVDHVQNFWQPQAHHPGGQYARSPTQSQYGVPQPPSTFHAHGPPAGQYPLQQPYYPQHHQHYPMTKQM